MDLEVGKIIHKMFCPYSRFCGVSLLLSLTSQWSFTPPHFLSFPHYQDLTYFLISIISFNLPDFSVCKLDLFFQTRSYIFLLFKITTWNQSILGSLPKPHMGNKISSIEGDNSMDNLYECSHSMG